MLHDDAVYAPEHALEVELPFLQSTLSAFVLVPLLVGDATPQQVALILDRLWGGPETLIVVSSDLSHYLANDAVRRRDAATAAANERGDWAGLGPDDACGSVQSRGCLSPQVRRGLPPGGSTCAVARTSWDTAPGRYWTLSNSQKEQDGGRADANGWLWHFCDLLARAMKVRY